MVKRATFFELTLNIPADRQSKQTALYEALRAAIVSRSMAPNQRLPSTREFARLYGIARGTAVIVYEQLKSEAYLVARRGAGTFVPGSLPDHRLIRPNPCAEQEHCAGIAQSPALSRFGRQLLSSPPAFETERRCLPFSPHQIALDRFPIDVWARLAAKHCRLAKPELLNHADGAGWPRLRRTVAAYLGAARGLSCTCEQVVLTSSTRQSLLLCAQLLTERGDQALVEDPGHPQAVAILRAAGINVIPVPVGPDGVQLDAAAGRASIAYVTPAHQYPTGAVMSAERARALLDWAARHGAWVFENDYGSDFRYEGRPTPCLQSMDRCGRVLHAGSFSTSVFPGLRISYLVVPPALAEPFSRMQGLYGPQPSILSQVVLCDFMESGHFARHLRRMAECYRERRAALVQMLGQAFGDSIEIGPAASGLQFAVWWGSGGDSEAIARASASHGVSIVPLSRYRIANPVRAGALLGFAAYDIGCMRDAVGQLLRAVLHGDRQGTRRATEGTSFPFGTWRRAETRPTGQMPEGVLSRTVGGSPLAPGPRGGGL